MDSSIQPINDCSIRKTPSHPFLYLLIGTRKPDWTISGTAKYLLQTNMNPPPTAHRLVICSQHPRTLKILKKADTAPRNPTSLVGEETGLLEEILPYLRQFRSYKTHTFSKRDHNSSTEKFLLQNCITCMANDSSPPKTQYSPNGQTTLWIEGIEISNTLAYFLRNAKASALLNKHLQRKHNWSYKTLSMIDWGVHGRALMTLTDRQRKTITQMIHQWMPVNGHPGRALQFLERKCPACRDEDESQAHFMSCPALRGLWHATIAASALSENTQNADNHINAMGNHSSQ
jgi:hypothetical protein